MQQKLQDLYQGHTERIPYTPALKKELVDVRWSHALLQSAQVLLQEVDLLVRCAKVNESGSHHSKTKSHYAFWSPASPSSIACVQILVQSSDIVLPFVCEYTFTHTLVYLFTIDKQITYISIYIYRYMHTSFLFV